MDQAALRLFGFATLWAILFPLTPAIYPHIITPVPGKFVLDGAIGEWLGRPPVQGSLSVVPPYSNIWLGRSEKGLVVAGRFRTETVRFPKNAAELEHSGRLELWLAAADSVEFPPLTYEEQACDGGSRGSEPKKLACLEWVKQQAVFREGILKQFTRMWRIEGV